jgi:hypothetical protein
VTKTEQRRLARRARQYGYHRQDTVLWVFCPLCRERVYGDWGTATRGQRTLTQELDRAMIEHLWGYCEHPDSGSLETTENSL